MANKNYNTSSIEKMSDIEHIRHSPGMYVGSTEDPTHILIECLDNALDEVNAKHANRITIEINNKENYFCITDNGRGIPNDFKLSINEDPPVLICTTARTSGKFTKTGDGNTAYDIAIGTHGYGLSVVFALSKKMEILLHKNKKNYVYELNHKKINRKELESGKQSYSTQIKVYPDDSFFSNININTQYVYERLLLARMEFPNIEIIYTTDEKEYEIPVTSKEAENLLIKENLTENLINDSWITVDYKNGVEECSISFMWDDEDTNIGTKSFTSVNLVKVLGGYHETVITSAIKSTLSKLGKKYNFDFNDSDTMNWMRLFVKFKLLKPKYESQTKEKLSRNTDLEILKDFSTDVEKYFKNKNNEEFTKQLLERFHNYRKSIQNKKLMKNSSTGKRGLTKFTALKDCTKEGGELLIGEGESAVSGLIRVRDPKKHAILPLGGVPPNVETKSKISDLTKNEEVSDIITALGCGITPHCNLNNLRYEKIIIAADADPAGEFISSLLLLLFAKLFPEVIKNGNLYVCRTPLYGFGYKDKFTPIWTKTELEDVRKNNTKIRRFKGLGEFEPSELKKFTLDEKTRKIIQMSWSSNIKSIFELMSSAEERRKLVLGEWKIGE